MPRVDDDHSVAPPVKVQLAINLFDVERIDPQIRGMMFRGKLNNRPVRIDKERGDEVGVIFHCDLLTAACLCDTIRNHDRQAGDYPTRVYLKRDAWSKLSSTTVLTEVEGDKVVLNPAVFRVAVAGNPLEPEAIRFEG